MNSYLRVVSPDRSKEWRDQAAQDRKVRLLKLGQRGPKKLVTQNLATQNPEPSVPTTSFFDDLAPATTR